MSVFRKKLRNRHAGEYYPSPYLYIAYRLANGKRHQERTPFRPRQKWQAKQLLKQRKAEQAKTKASLARSSPASPTSNPLIGGDQAALAELHRRFLQAMELRRRPKTCDFYAARLAHVIGWLASATPSVTIVGQLSPQALEDFIGDQKGCVADATINHSLKAIKRLVSWAIDQRLVGGPSPIAAVKTIRATPARPGRMPLTPEDFQKLHAAAPARRRLWWLFLVLTGLRNNEMRGLRLANYRQGFIDVPAELSKNGEARTVPLGAGLAQLTHGYLTRDLKTRGERMDAAIARLESRLTRGVPDPRDQAVLDRYRRERNHDRLFTNRDGFPIHNNMLRAIKADAKRAGIRAIDVHSLRYTYNSWSLLAGVDHKVLMSRMGHKRPDMTLNRYAPAAFFVNDDGLAELAAQAGLTASPTVSGAAVQAEPIALSSRLPLTRELLAALAPRYSDRTIAAVAGVSCRAVGKALKRHDIGRDRRIVNVGLTADQIRSIRAKVLRDLETGTT